MAAVVQTSYGRVRGTTRDGVTAFLGIPYAAPPFGPNRFRPPRPPEPWDGVRDAAEYGATAPKPGYPRPFDTLIPDPDIPGEDCLNLNVWTPYVPGGTEGSAPVSDASPEPGGSGLPVMVWIHGGAFRNGSGAVPIYNGHNFARDQRALRVLRTRTSVVQRSTCDDSRPQR
jgi:para-nitrobenzyl esterase